MKSFDILRKLKRGYTQEHWTVCIFPIKIAGRGYFLHKVFVNGSALKKTIYAKYEDFSLGEYGTFVTKYNGVSLFSGSFNVFGYNFSANEAKFKPMDIGVENGILRRYNKNGELLYIASLGDYLFALKKGEEKIYCTKKGSSEVVIEWNGFDEFFVYMYKSLLRLYDENGNKISPNKSKFPEVVNRTLEMDEVISAHKEIEEEEIENGIEDEFEPSGEDLEEEIEEEFEEISSAINFEQDTEDELSDDEDLSDDDEVDLDEIRVTIEDIFS